MSTFHQAISGRASKKERKSRHIWLIGLAAFLFVIAACLIFPWFLKTCCSLEQSDTGTFGDQYGALNTFFSGLAFAGLVIAILLQREDLKLQREEMREARTEAAKQTKEAEAQTALMAEQTLSTSLFSYLEAMQKSKDQLHLTPSSFLTDVSTEQCCGEIAVHFLYEELRKLIKGILYIDLGVTHKKEHESVEDIFRTPYLIDSIDQTHQARRELYSKIKCLRNWVLPFQLWLKRIEKSQLPNTKKKEYEQLLFDSLIPKERAVLCLFSIMTRLHIHVNGIDLAADDQAIQLVWDTLLSDTFEDNFKFDNVASDLVFLILVNFPTDIDYLTKGLIDFYTGKNVSLWNENE